MPHFADCTPSQGPGPFYCMTLLYDDGANGVDPQAPNAVRVKGTVYDGGGTPLRPPDAFIELLTDDAFARTTVSPSGQYEVVMHKPTPVQLADGRTQAPFIFVRLWAFPVIECFETRLYFSDEVSANHDDSVLQLVAEDVRDTIVGRFENGILHWDIHLSGEQQTVFFVPTEGPSIADAPAMGIHPAISSVAV